MSNRSRAIFLFLTIVAVVLVSAVGTTSVFADDGTPPPPATETAAVDPSTGEAEPATEPAEAAPASEPVVVEPVEAAPVSEPVVVEPAEAAPTSEPVVVEPAEAAPVAEEKQAAKAEAASILEQVPEDTAVTVLNATGEAQPLTSQESAEAINASDPVWCPGDALPGSDGCTEAFDSFDSLLSFLKDNEDEDVYKQGGTIYVEAGTYAGGESSIDFNSYEFASLNNYDLKIQGGWDKATNDTSGTTSLNASISIGTDSNPWVGSLSFNNIWIDGVTDQAGLTVFSQNNISLDNVQVTGSQAGADLNAGVDVYVAGSNFSKNQKFGAKIKAGGYVEVRNSNFDDNKSSWTDGFGLEIDNQGDTLLQAVSAQRNETFGADIDSVASVAVLGGVFDGNISYSNCSNSWKSCYCKETKNGGYGLQIVSHTNEVYLQGIEANGNYLFGAHLEGTKVSVLELEVDGVVTGNTFNGNGSGSLNNPQGYGLQIVSTDTSSKAVTLTNVQANNNQLFGADIQAKGKVKISNSFFSGNKSYYNTCTSPKSCQECKQTYYGYGIKVVTDGDISMNQVSANDNYLFGAHLEGGLVAISGANANSLSSFSNNGSGSSSVLTGKGLEIISTYQVNLANVTASNNQLFGADIQAADNILISNGYFNGHKVYTYSGDCTGNTKNCHNPKPCVKTLVGGGYGLQADSTNGIVALAGVEANDNYLFGAHLSGTEVDIATGSFNKNKEGLNIESDGDVNIDEIHADSNQLSGATITSGEDVEISDSTFSGNLSYASSSYQGYGLKVIAAGYIKLVGVTADKNYLSGAHLEGKSITARNSSFSDNGTGVLSDHVGQGLEIISTGSDSLIQLSNVTANGNQLFGANIQAEGYVSIINSYFSGNMSYYSNCGTHNSGGSKWGGSSGGKTCHECTTTYDGYGLQVVTTGDIYLNTVEANDNYLFGAHLEGANVDINFSVFNSNVSPTQQGKTPTGRGLEVISTGNTSLESVTASKNQLFGADIQAGGNVEIISSFFDDNKYYTSYSPCKGKQTAGYGLKVVATGTITLGSAETPNIGVEANTNGAEGAILNGQSTVTVVDSFFNNNGANGLTITANGLVTLTNVTATGNKGSGAEVTGICTNIVHVDGGAFDDNSKYGLKVSKASYEQGATPSFDGNGSGGLFVDSSTCVSGGSGTGTGDTGGSTGGNNDNHHGWNWWYWWWFWHHGFGHH